MTSGVSIYRVENWRGAGPYNHKFTELRRMHDAHHINRPHPNEDGIAKLVKREYCGFGSREDLEWWFRGHKRSLDLTGFNIAVYKVALNKIRFGHRQLVFARGDLLPFEHLPILRNGRIHES